MGLWSIMVVPETPYAADAVSSGVVPGPLRSRRCFIRGLLTISLRSRCCFNESDSLAVSLRSRRCFIRRHPTLDRVTGAVLTGAKTTGIKGSVRVAAFPPTQPTLFHQGYSNQLSTQPTLFHQE